MPRSGRRHRVRTFSYRCTCRSPPGCPGRAPPPRRARPANRSRRGARAPTGSCVRGRDSRATRIAPRVRCSFTCASAPSTSPNRASCRSRHSCIARSWRPSRTNRACAVDTSRPVIGGVKPLTLQAECGFRAYGEMRLGAEALETPAPGLDARERGMLLHKALELVWIKLGRAFRADCHRNASAAPDDRRLGGRRRGRPCSAVTCRSNCSRRSSARSSPARKAHRKPARTRTNARAFHRGEARSAPRSRHRRRAVRIAHRSHRFHRRRRLRDPRLQVG